MREGGGQDEEGGRMRGLSEEEGDEQDEDSEGFLDEEVRVKKRREETGFVCSEVKWNDGACLRVAANRKMKLGR